MINNRQNGRRRGRGGGGPRPNNSPSPGNRQDNRSRGNAAQLHEKYKALARDSQLAGDRVQTETYLQFADHYFRVLGEGRARFEEQRPRSQGDFMSDDDEDQDEGQMAQEDGGRDYRDSRYDRPEPRQDREPRPERPEREARPDREQRPDREVANDQRPEREAKPEPSANPSERNGGLRPRRVRPARDDDGDDVGGDGQIALDSLPPAISADAEAKAPRRRAPRRARPEDDADIAPAA